MIGTESTLKRFTVIFEKNDVEIARFAVQAANREAAENQGENLFAEQHPELDIFDKITSLELRVEEG
jgi:hypothetical protein